MSLPLEFGIGFLKHMIQTMPLHASCSKAFSRALGEGWGLGFSELILKNWKKNFEKNFEKIWKIFLSPKIKKKSTCVFPSEPWDVDWSEDGKKWSIRPAGKADARTPAVATVRQMKIKSWVRRVGAKFESWKLTWNEWNQTHCTRKLISRNIFAFSTLWVQECQCGSYGNSLTHFWQKFRESNGFTT